MICSGRPASRSLTGCCPTSIRRSLVCTDDVLSLRVRDAGIWFSPQAGRKIHRRMWSTLRAIDSASSTVRNLFLIGAKRQEIEGSPGSNGRSDGQIKRTAVRWLPSVARVCLHIGFCKFSRRQNGSSQRVQVPPFAIS
jgi:hypothetical protein